MGKLRKSNFTLKSLTSIISLYMDIQTYRELLQQIIEESPNERVYQLKLIQPFLEEIFKEKKDKNNPAFHSSNHSLLFGSVYLYE